MRLQRPALMLAALWWGGITALSFLAVPTLFASLGSPAVAGPVAAKLFSLQCWAGVVIGAALLIIVQRDGPGGDNAALLTLVCLGLWHGVGTAFVLGQWLSSGALLWRLSRPRPAIDQPA